MRDELQESLYNRFPDLYWEHVLDKSQSCMYYGLYVGDGWYPILESLSEELSQIVSAQKLNPKKYCFAQVKEKFGLLRIYFTRSTEEMNQAVCRAVEQSKVTCETCGEKGSLIKEGWMRVTCDQCEEKRRKTRRRMEAERQKEKDLELSTVDSAMGLER